MNSQQGTMEFTSKRYTKEELESIGVIIFKSITCRNIDVQNPHFINFHLHDMMINSRIKILNDQAYIIEAKNHKTKKELAVIEILIFSNMDCRDRFVLNNSDNFKMTINDKVIYEPLLLKYMN